MGEQPRNKNGQFVPKKGNGKAIYTSIGPGTCNMKGLILTVRPARLRDEKTAGDKGKRIEFKKGRYETTDPGEIEFLDKKVENPRPFSAIKCIQKPEIKKEKNAS